MRQFILLIILCGLISCKDYNQPATFTNPIMQGFYPDPSICKAGDSYFLVQSSFSYFPGLPIFESKDLINWRQIGHVMDRPSQLNTIGARISRGLFAPTIRYHDGTFYVVCTLIDKGGNFIVTAKDPAGPWSEPEYFPEINGIDPSIFFEGDKTFLTYNSIPPDDVSLWDGHRTIRMREIDREQMKVIGEEIILVDGGTDKAIKPVWIEAPHIYQVNDYYNLMCAQGGTGYNHTEVVFRSKKVQGPYIPYEGNPILTQKHLDPQRAFPITTTGHADLVQTDNGDWWAVFLGCRPYEPGYYNIGRETFMTPVKWQDGWPIINPDFEEVQYQYPVPIKGTRIESSNWPTGNFEVTDQFDSSRLDYTWVFLRTPQNQWHSLDEKPSQISISTRPETCAQLRNPSYIGRRQQHISFSASTLMDFSPVAENEKAGLLIFQGELNYFMLTTSLNKGKPVVELFQASDTTRGPANSIKLLASQSIDTGAIQLKIDCQGGDIAFYFKQGNDDWQLLKDKVNAKLLSTRVAGGFVGSTIGLYSTSLGQPSSSKAYFDWFKYSGNDEVYTTMK